jgi:hypothetical protein
MVAGLAWAARCSGPLRIGEKGLGVVWAHSLQIASGITRLGGACFLLQGYRFETPELVIRSGVVRAAKVAVSARGFSGSGQGFSYSGGSYRVTSLAVSLTLPNAQLGALPLGPGRYRLRASAATLFRGTFRAELAALRGAGARYRLRAVRFAPGYLSATQVQLRQGDVSATAGSLSVRAGTFLAVRPQLSLCRVPTGRDLVLRGSSLFASPALLQIERARLELFGHTFAYLARLSLGLPGGPDTAQTTLANLRAVAAQLAQLVQPPPSLLLGGNPFGIGVLGVPLLGFGRSRLSLAAYTLPGGALAPEFNVVLPEAGGLFAAGLFAANSDSASPPGFTLVWSRNPAAGALDQVQIGAKLDSLRYFALGQAWPLGSAFRLSALAGGAQQGAVAAPFAEFGLRGGSSFYLGQVSGQYTLDGHAYALGSSPYATLRYSFSAFRPGDGWYLSLTQSGQAAWGGSPISALQPGKGTSAMVQLSLPWSVPDLSSLGTLTYGLDFPSSSPLQDPTLSLQQDWLTGQLSAGLGARLQAPAAALGTLKVGPSQLSWQYQEDLPQLTAAEDLWTLATQLGQSASDFAWSLAPTVGYDLASGQISLAGQLTLESTCLGLQLGASYQSAVPGIPASSVLSLGAFLR